jgi:urease accessory protein
MNHYLGKLLHLSDPTLPIGGFNHSSGLETYVQLGIVADANSAELFVRNMLEHNLAYNDAAFVSLAYAAAGNADLASLLDLDRECGALKAPAETRQASRKLGVRLFKIFESHAGSPLVEACAQAIAAGKAEGHHAIIFGLYARVFEIPLYEAVYSFCYAAAVNMITNSVKLVPLGQLSGQDILFRLEPVLARVAQTAIGLQRELVGVCNVGFDIRCMQHEKLYSRLYMS